MAAAAPVREIALRPDFAASYPPDAVARRPGDTEVHMCRRVLRVARVVDASEHGAGANPHAWLDALRDPQQMRAVVTDAVVAHDRDRAAAAGRTGVNRWIPPVT